MHFDGDAGRVAARRGKIQPRGRQSVESFAARLDVLSFDSEAAAHYADIRADLERRGEVIGPYDMMIAGHARSRGLTVITGNLEEFTRVAALRAEDWLAPSGVPTDEAG